MSDDKITPIASPSELSKHSGVRRVNNLPLYLIGGALITFLAVMGWVAFDKASQAIMGAKETSGKHGDTSQIAKSIAGNQLDGLVPAAGTPTPLSDTITVPIAMPTDDLEKPPMPKRLKAADESGQDMDQINQQKIQRFENAVTGKTSVPIPELKVHGDSSDADQKQATLGRIADAEQQIASIQDDTNAAFKAKLAQIQGGGGGATASNTAIKLMEPPNSQRNSLKPFDAKDGTDRWQLNSQVEAPKTPYTLRAGFVIPVSLISGINSDLPGQIIAQISQNVYDTATGKYLLLPQGSRLVGSYTSDVSYGQSRVMVAWQRIVLPDGKTMDIGAMPGADGAGYAGFNDQVNNHYLRLFGSAILMSGITAGVALSQDNNVNGGLYTQPNASSALSEALGQQLGTSTAQMITKNLNMSPTLEIRPGFRFNVMCIKDLVLNKPYSSFDYQAKE